MAVRPTLRIFATAVALLALTLGVPASGWAYDTSGAAQAIEVLNQQRAANGLPPVSLDQSLLKSECTLQNHEIASPGNPDWSASTSPWDNAPLHQLILYNPANAGASYAVYGPSESSFPGWPSGINWTCMWFTTDWTASSSTGMPAFYAFTSETGRSQVPTSETVDEWPTTPNAMVGLPATAGPNLLVYALGIGSAPHIVSASLTTAGGASVAVKTADGTTPYNGSPILFPWTGDVIPAQPLHGGTTYNVVVNWQGGDPSCDATNADYCGTDYTQTFSFSTVYLSNTVGIQQQAQKDGSVRLVVQSQSPDPSLTLTGQGRTLTPSLEASGKDYIAELSAVPPGSYRACVSSGGGATGYEKETGCKDVTLPIATGRYLTFSPRLVRGRILSMTIRADPPFVGRRVLLNLHVYLGCNGKCWAPGHREWCSGDCLAVHLAKRIALRPKRRLALRMRWVPARGNEVFAQFSISKGMLGTVPYGRIAGTWHRVAH